MEYVSVLSPGDLLFQGDVPKTDRNLKQRYCRPVVFGVNRKNGCTEVKVS